MTITPAQEGIINLELRTGEEVDLYVPGEYVGCIRCVNEKTHMRIIVSRHFIKHHIRVEVVEEAV
jgi:hypothetical protein